MHQAVHQDAIPPSQLNPDVQSNWMKWLKKQWPNVRQIAFRVATDFMQALKAVTTGIIDAFA